MVRETQLTLSVNDGTVSAILTVPDAPRFVFVIAHGAGASMRHAFLGAIASGLAERGGATLRYNFPYMEAGSGRVDPPGIAHAAVRAAVQKGRELVPDVPVIAGGKSFGGRMTSGAQADSPMPGVAGLAFLGFPLHPPGRPGVERAEHLKLVTVPMLFLQGSRDEFAALSLLEGVVRELGALATLDLVAGGDHSFKVPRSSGQTPAQVQGLLCDGLVAWGVQHCGIWTPS